MGADQRRRPLTSDRRSDGVPDTDASRAKRARDRSTELTETGWQHPRSRAAGGRLAGLPPTARLRSKRRQARQTGPTLAAVSVAWSPAPQPLALQSAQSAEPAEMSDVTVRGVANRFLLLYRSNASDFRGVQSSSAQRLQRSLHKIARRVIVAYVELSQHGHRIGGLFQSGRRQRIRENRDFADDSLSGLVISKTRPTPEALASMST